MGRLVMVRQHDFLLTIPRWGSSISAGFCLHLDTNCSTYGRQVVYVGVFAATVTYCNGLHSLWSFLSFANIGVVQIRRGRTSTPTQTLAHSISPGRHYFQYVGSDSKPGKIVVFAMSSITRDFAGDL